MDLFDSIKAWLADQSIDDDASYSSLGSVKIFSEEDEDRPMIFSGEDAFKIVQSEVAAKSFVELFEDPSEYTIEIRKISIKASVSVLFNDVFAYVEEA